MVKKTILFLVITYTLNCSAQRLSVDSIISPNQLTTYSNQNLILLDFWATWCMPCIPATKQLEILQEQYPQEIFIVSITDEPNNKIISYLKEKPIKLMVVSDYLSGMITRYNVSSRPYSVLLDKFGEVLWEGKPGDFTDNVLKKYIKKTQRYSVISRDWKLIMESRDSIKAKMPKTIIPTYASSDIQVSKLTDKNNTHFDYIGTVKDFISEYKFIPKMLVEDGSVSSQKIGINFPKSIIDSISKPQLADSVLDKLNYEMVSRAINFPINELRIENKNLLWDTNQIVWDVGSPQFLISDISIEADNISLNQLAYQLSNLKYDLYIYFGEDKTLHDFSFVYSDDKLMKDELKNSFGIKIESQKRSVLTYNFRNKPSKDPSIRIE